MNECEPVLYETHMHTLLCNHAEGTPDEYAGKALERGLKGITVTCHCPLPDRISPGVRMAPDEWDEYVELVAACRERWKDRVDVRLGLESDFLPGLESWLEELHSREPLHFVLGSVHPQLSEYKALFFKGDWPSFHDGYFSQLAEAAETGLFDSLSHPDLVKNYGTEEWDVDARMDHIRRCLDRIAETGVAMELNTSGLQKTLPEMNPSLRILREMRERDIPVTVGADAHSPDRVAGDFPTALRTLQEAGYTHSRYYLNREPVEVPLEQSLASLNVETASAV